MSPSALPRLTNGSPHVQHGDGPLRRSLRGGVCQDAAQVPPEHGQGADGDARDFGATRTAAFAKNEARLGSRDDENYDDLPAHFSWTDKQPGFGDVVGEVHNQQDICASCWAFVSADSIAGRWAVATKTDVVPMSVKQLMACDHQDNGCNTGNMYTAYDWIGENGGLSTQEAYDARVPGETQDDESATCDTSSPLEITTPGMCDLKMTAGNRALMIAIKEAGPVAIGINANNLQFYESGIIDAASCPRGPGHPEHQPRRAGGGVGRGGRH